MGRRNPERDVIVVERGGASVGWLLVGGAVGAGLALLFAPQSGAQTRRQLGVKIAKLKDSAEVALGELKDAIDPPTAEAEDAADDALEPVAGGRRGVSPARRELEKRLAVARARRQQVPTDDDEEPVA